LNFAALAFREPDAHVPTLARLTAYPINDVSTDIDAPPPLDGRDGTPAGGPPLSEGRRAKLRRAYPELLGGLLLPLPPEKAFSLAEATARAQPRWNFGRVDTAARLLTAVAVTPLLRFKDDVTIRIRPEGSGSRVDVRSRSRVGRDDLGTNAARIRHFLGALRAAAGRL
jgi:hypothetical protein